MKKKVAIVLICLLLLNGTLYTVTYGRRYTRPMLEEQVVRRRQNIYEMQTRGRDVPSPFATFSVDWNEKCTKQINHSVELIHSWFCRIEERMMQYEE